jgi:hypothetical protein
MCFGFESPLGTGNIWKHLETCRQCEMFQSIPVIPVIPGPAQHFPQGNKVRVQRVQRVQAEKLKRQIAQAVPTVNRCEQVMEIHGTYGT